MKMPTKTKKSRPTCRPSKLCNLLKILEMPTMPTRRPCNARTGVHAHTRPRDIDITRAKKFFSVREKTWSACRHGRHFFFNHALM